MPRRHFANYHEHLIARHERRYGPLHRYARTGQVAVKADSTPEDVAPHGLRKLFSIFRAPVRL